MLRHAEENLFVWKWSDGLENDVGLLEWVTEKEGITAENRRTEKMGTYCEKHLTDAINKYIERAEDGKVIIEYASMECPCSNTDCDDEGIYVVGYHPKRKED